MHATRSRLTALIRAAPLLLLSAAVVLVALLAWRARAAAASHRALAERVLHDYAELAATEFGRRSANVVGTYGFAIALRGLTAAAGDAHGALPSVAAAAAAMPAASRNARELIGAIIRFDTRGERFETTGRDIPSDVRRALTDAAARPPANAAVYGVAHPIIDGATRSFVFAVGDTSGGAGTERLGFEVRPEALAAWLRDFVLAEPLLPAALAADASARSSIAVLVRSPDGRTVLRAGALPVAPAATVVRDLAADDRTGALRGFTVQVAIDPLAAERLIIGGLPDTRVAPLLALLALAIGLAAAAAMQMRRERALAEARQDFVTRTSHELRTPVARMRMFTDTLLLDRVRNDAERRQALQAIDRAARRLAMLVENVLQFSRVDGAGAPPAARTDVAELTREVVAEFESLVDAPGHHTVDGPAALEGTVDGETVRQVLLNLLDNAWKYGGTSPATRVTLAMDGAELALSVDDGGPGIPERDRPRVWEPYARLDRDRRSPVAGTGIGLAVVRDLVRRTGGRHWIETAPGGGTRVVVTFPAAPLAPRTGAA